MSPRPVHYSDALARGKKVIAHIAEVFGGFTARTPPASCGSSRGWPPNTPPAKQFAFR